MSAILGTQAYKCYFNQGIPPVVNDKCAGPHSSTQGGITAAMPGGSWVGKDTNGQEDNSSSSLARGVSLSLISEILWTWLRRANAFVHYF